MLDNKAEGPVPESPCAEPIDAHIGGRAAARRETLGLSLDDVAQALGVDRATLDDVERGHQRFRARQLWTLSRRLQVPMAWFFKMPAGAKPSPETPGRTSVRVLFVSNGDLDDLGGTDHLPVH